jgi:hypothetical protein
MSLYIKRFRTLLPLVAALVCGVILGAPSQAHATFEMKITSSLGGSVIIDDGDDGSAAGHAKDLNSAAGVITFIGGIGGFTIQVNTGESKPVLGSAAAPQMDLNYDVTKTGLGAETLTIQISDTDFTTSPLPMVMTWGGTNGAGTNSTMFAGTGLNNALYNISDASGSLGPFGSGAFSGTGGFTIPNNSGNKYSLTDGVTINAVAYQGSSNVYSGDANINGAPAPAGIVLLLTGMPVLGVGAWLRRRRVPTAA